MNFIFKKLKYVWTICRFKFIDWTNSNREKRGGSSAMKKQKLNYRFHNPNPVDATADYILKVFIESNTSKVERVIEEAAKDLDDLDKDDIESKEEHSA